MTNTATLLGFGSYFVKEPKQANDVDLLLLHRNVERDSIEFAIACKKLIRAVLPTAHIIMLSDEEERELGFIRRSSAVHLLDINDAFAPEQIARFCSQFVPNSIDATI